MDDLLGAIHWLALQQCEQLTSRLAAVEQDAFEAVSAERLRVAQHIEALHQSLAAREKELAASRIRCQDLASRLATLQDDHDQVAASPSASWPGRVGELSSPPRPEPSAGRSSDVQPALILQAQLSLSARLAQAFQRLARERASFAAERGQHARELRELAVLRIECSRRYGLLKQSQQQQSLQDAQLNQLRAELVELRQQLADRPAFAAPLPVAAEVQMLEQQLQAARDEAELLLLQLKQTQDELAERELEQPRPASAAQWPALAVPSPTGLSPGHPLPSVSDTDVINALRQHLLASC